MPALKNARHERFCQNVAKGMSATDAYAEAGYNGGASHASRLATNGNIKARIAELMGKAAEKAEISVARVLEELAKVGFANMADYIRTTDEGDAYVDLSKLDRDKASVISEVTVEDFKDGRGEDARDVRKIKFKLHDKLSALEKLGKHLGMFRERVELTGKDGAPIETRDVSDRDRAKALAALIGKSKSGGSA